MKRLTSLLFSALAIAAVAFSGHAAADDHDWAWRLDAAASRLGFLSLKNVNIAEAHRFGELSGGIDTAGEARFTISLDSVDTAVPIRNERMRELLFETSLHPEAIVEAELDLAELEALPVGESRIHPLRFTLVLREQQTPLLGEVEVTRVSEDELHVATTAPILLNASKLGLAPGVEKLREIAGLKSISLSVPTWFQLELTRS